MCHTDTDAANGNSSVHEEPSDPNLHTTQNTSEIEHYNQPAEGDEENEGDDQKETKQEQKHRLDQSEEYDNNNKEVNATVQHQQEAVPDQEEAHHEGEMCRDSTEPEDTEQVETFFSTMSHRYENATQEGHIL